MDFLGSNSKYKSLMMSMAAVGATIDKFEENSKTISFDEPMYTIKFSIPESWQLGIFDDLSEDTKADLERFQVGGVVDAERVKLEFKDSMNKIFLDIFRSEEENDDYDDDFLEECLQFIRFLCRVRKGEIWTRDLRNLSIFKTKKEIHMIEQLVQASKEYGEV